MSRKPFLGALANPKLYHPELRKVTKSITGAILWQQLEYWFGVMSDKGEKYFFKYLSTPEGSEEEKNKKGWTEELGFSEEEFRSAFRMLGVAYGSKTEFVSQEDKFQNKMYCSYYDRVERKTYYFRNEKKVLEQLEIILNDWSPETDKPSFPETDKPSLPKPTNPVSPIYKETNNTTKNKITNTPPTPPRGGAEEDTEIEEERKTEVRTGIASMSSVEKTPPRKISKPTLDTQDEKEVFALYKKYFWTLSTNKMTSIATGIKLAIKIFEENYKDEGAKKLKETLEEMGNSTEYMAYVESKKWVVAPKVFLSESYIRNYILSRTQNFNGKLEQPVTAEEIARIDEENNAKLRERVERLTGSGA